MRIRMNGNVYEGSAEAIVEQIRQGWYWTPIPTTEQLFQLASGLLKRPIKDAKAYIQAMVDLGIAKMRKERPLPKPTIGDRVRIKQRVSRHFGEEGIIVNVKQWPSGSTYGVQLGRRRIRRFSRSHLEITEKANA